MRYILFFLLYTLYIVLHCAVKSHLQDIIEIHNYYIIPQTQYKYKCYPFFAYNNNCLIILHINMSARMCSPLSELNVLMLHAQNTFLHYILLHKGCDIFQVMM